VAWLGGMTERRRKVAVMVAPARSTWADHPSAEISEGKPTRKKLYMYKSCRRKSLSGNARQRKSWLGYETNGGKAADISA